MKKLKNVTNESGDRSNNILATAGEEFSYSAILLLLFILFTFACPVVDWNPAQVFAGGKSDLTVSSLIPVSQAQNSTIPPDFFPILPWDPLHGFRKPYINRKLGLRSISECNFTMAGFVRTEDLTLCEKLGLSAFMMPEVGFIRAAEWKKMSDEEIDRTIKTMVDESGRSRAIMGYFITDEPGASAFPALAKAVRAVKKYAPGKLAYINLFPDYATLGAKDKSQLETETYTEYLERFVNEVNPQVISYDNYMVQYSLDLQDYEKTASYYRNLLEVRRIALKYDLPFWNIVSSNQIRPFTTIPSPANLFFQAYTTLAAGGKGVTWYTYYSRGYGYAPIDKAGNKTVTWRYLQEANRQIAVIGPLMNRMISTGVYFTSPVPVESLPELPGKFVRKVISKAPVMVGEFRSIEGEDYIMVVNLSLKESANFRLETINPLGKLEAVSAEDGEFHPVGDEKGLWLVAGQGVLMRLK